MARTQAVARPATRLRDRSRCQQSSSAASISEPNSWRNGAGYARSSARKNSRRTADWLCATTPLEQSLCAGGVDDAREAVGFGGARAAAERSQAIKARAAAGRGRVSGGGGLGHVASGRHLFKGAVKHAGP